jgi:hypothetical protein
LYSHYGFAVVGAIFKKAERFLYATCRTNHRNSLECLSIQVSISGIRGVIGSTLTPSVIVGFVSAFGHLQRTRFAAKFVLPSPSTDTRID